MDAARDALVADLGAADPYGRFRAYAPQAPEGRGIILHSKVMIVDDRFLRVGSSNLNNRSMGLDTECDLAIEAGEAEQEAKPARRSAPSAIAWLPISLAVRKNASRKRWPITAA